MLMLGGQLHGPKFYPLILVFSFMINFDDILFVYMALDH